SLRADLRNPHPCLKNVFTGRDARQPMTDAAPLWQPSPERIRAANITRFMAEAAKLSGAAIADYQALWRWSIADPPAFWALVCAFTGVIGDGAGPPAPEHPDAMPGAAFFPNARLNFTENLLCRNDASPAMLFWGEDKVKYRLSWAELHATVSRLQQALAAMG